MAFIDYDALFCESPQAQQTEYNGTLYRSKLEAKTAQALDNLGIAYEYEPEGYKLSNGLWYKPDFLLPDAHQFIECKGKMTNTDSAKIVGLVEDTNMPVLAISYDNAMLVMRVNNNRDFEITTYQGDEVALAWCSKCKKPWFVAWPDTYECQCCGYYDGDRSFYSARDIASATDLFNYGQKIAADKPLYKEIANNFNN